jgi:hypothetical protein
MDTSAGSTYRSCCFYILVKYTCTYVSFVVCGMAGGRRKDGRSMHLMQPWILLVDHRSSNNEQILLNVNTRVRPDLLFISYLLLPFPIPPSLHPAMKVVFMYA